MTSQHGEQQTARRGLAAFAAASALAAFASLAACDESSAASAAPRANPGAPAPEASPAEALEAQCNRCGATCALADADACYKLGQLYDAGQGVAQNRQRAKHLFERAAKAGHAQAKNQLGRSWGL